MPSSLKQIAKDLILKGYAVCELGDELYDKVSLILTNAQDFFSLTFEEKIQQASPNMLEGFRGQGIEYSQTVERPDLNESFSVWKGNQGKETIANRFLENKLHQAMSLSMKPLTILGDSIFESLLNEINPSGQPITVSDYSYLQVNYYEPYKHDREFLQDAHEDGHLLTIAKSTAPGLEVLIDGEYKSIPLAKKEVLLMPGSILTLITGGLIKPLYHRVRNEKTIMHREAVMFFINPSAISAQKVWVENDTNKGIDIRKKAVENSTHFGLPKNDFNFDDLYEPK